MPVCQPAVASAAVAQPAAATSGSTFHPLTPARILDTRDGTGGLVRFANHAAQTLQVTGHGGVPTTAIAVTGNVTVTGQSCNGFVFAGPVANNNPTSSTLNFPVGDDRANAVNVALGTGGTLSFTYVGSSASCTSQLIFDVTGYFTPDSSGATYHPLTPARVLDTRDNTGGLVQFANHVPQTLQLTGHGGVVAGSSAVTGNLTVTGQSCRGFVFTGPTPTNNPTSSTLNFPINDDRANAVTVALGTGGTLSFTYVGSSDGCVAHVIFDVTGYFTGDQTGASYFPLNPTRVLDTRDGTGGLAAFGNHAAQTLQLTGNGGVPSGATATTGNLTVTAQTCRGFVFAGPVATNDPTSSNLNFPLRDDRANAVTVALSNTGGLSLTYVGSAPGCTSQVIFDVTGFFAMGGGTESIVVGVDGTGSAGDAQNRTNVNTGTTPNHPTRSITIEFLTATGQAAVGADGHTIGSLTGTITFQPMGPNSGKWTSTVTLPVNISTGSYRLRLTLAGHLRRLMQPTTITAGAKNLDSDVAYMIAGDVDGNNVLNSSDSDSILAVYGSTFSASQPYDVRDLDDDGAITGFDYNLFAREFVVYPTGD